MAVDFLVFSLRRAASTGKQGQNFEAEAAVEPLARRPHNEPLPCVSPSAHRDMCAQAASVPYKSGQRQAGLESVRLAHYRGLASFWETQHSRDPLLYKLRLG